MPDKKLGSNIILKLGMAEGKLFFLLRAKQAATLLQSVVGSLCHTIVVYLVSGKAMDDFSACSVAKSYVITGSPLQEQ